MKVVDAFKRLFLGCDTGLFISNNLLSSPQAEETKPRNRYERRLEQKQNRRGSK